MTSLTLLGDISGSVVLDAPAVSGSTTLTLPTTSGTILTNRTAGCILQVIRSDYTTLASTTNTASWSNIGSATITPQSASNKILITATYHVSGIGALRLLRNSTALNTPTNTYMTYSYYPASVIQTAYNQNSDRQIVSMQYYDSPSTTASTTYNVEMIAYPISQTTGIGVNEIYTGVTFSGITLMEVAA